MKRGGMFGHEAAGKLLAQATQAAQEYAASPEGQYKKIMENMWITQEHDLLKKMPGNPNYGFDNEVYPTGTFDEWWASNVWKPYFEKWQETGGRIYFKL
jgi:hypothetical protein